MHTAYAAAEALDLPIGLVLKHTPPPSFRLLISRQEMGASEWLETPTPKKMSNEHLAVEFPRVDLTYRSKIDYIRK